jgi:hypothetical protein
MVSKKTNKTALKAVLFYSIAIGLTFIPNQAHALVGYADTILDYYDSGAGPIPGPYGGTWNGTSGTSPIPVSLDVVLGDDPGYPPAVADFLSLPTGTYVTVGFVDETIIDGPGDDIFIREIGPNGERADVFVSSDSVTFTFLGTAIDDVTTALDLASIGFTEPVQAIKIVGLDTLGGSPGFDVINIEVLPGSIGPVEVEIDIKPGSCPNPLNVNSKGVLPVAILGTEDFDVSDIDVATVSLAGVVPIRFDYEDIATPFEGELCDCHDDGPDGYLDLTLKFETQEIVAALGDVEDGEELPLTLLVTLIDGTELEGSDCIRIIKKEKD